MITGVFLTIIGFIAIVSRKALAEMTVEYNSKLFKTKLGKSVTTQSQWMILIIGLLMVLLGVLAMSGIVPTK